MTVSKGRCLTLLTASPIKIQSASVAGIIRVAANRWSPFAEEKGLKFIVLRDATCPGIYSPAMLGIVLSNLLRNAIAYTVTGFIRIRETSNGLVVENSGNPISQTERERIFEPFKRGVAGAQTKAGERKGWGLACRSCSASQPVWVGK